MKSIKEILIERGYPERLAITTSEKLSTLSDKFAIARDKWLSEAKETDIESNGLSIFELMKQYEGMSYPAALLSIEWVYREPDKAKSIILRGIR